MASSVRAIRGQGLPYVYAMAGEVPPLLYFRLANKTEIEKVEGDGVLQRAARFRQTVEAGSLKTVIGEPGAPPPFLDAKSPLQKPYGVEKRLHFSVHSGRAAPDSGFAMARVFELEGRVGHVAGH